LEKVKRGVFFALAVSLTLSWAAAAGATNSSAASDRAMGRAPCIWASPIAGPDSALDVSATIRSLQDNHFNCIAQVIENRPPNSFTDFKRLLAAARSAKISVWAVLIPPSEGGTSQPYGTNYVGWMKAMARLSLKNPALRGVNIDDLLSGISTRTFTRQYVCSIYQAKQLINPKLLFVPTIYDLDRGVADHLAGCVDGAWFWWVNLEHDDGMRSLLEDSGVVVANRFPIYAGVYAQKTSWHPQGRPSLKVFRSALEIGCRYADGVIIWNLPLSPNSSANAWLAGARDFAPGGSANLAGKCGLGSTSP
jgi:hypothetical protein